MKRFVKLVINLFLGEKNGKEIGKMFYIAVIDVKEIKQLKARRDLIYFHNRQGTGD